MSDTFPSWRYGPDGQAMICQSAADVPEGWSDHPSKVAEPDDPFDHDGDGEPGGSLPKEDAAKKPPARRKVKRRDAGK
jgi:hypothetical protein